MKCEVMILFYLEVFFIYKCDALIAYRYIISYIRMLMGKLGTNEKGAENQINLKRESMPHVF